MDSLRSVWYICKVKLIKIYLIHVVLSYFSYILVMKGFTMPLCLHMLMLLHKTVLSVWLVSGIVLPMAFRKSSSSVEFSV